MTEVLGRGTVWGQFGTSEQPRGCFRAVTLLGINPCTYCTRAIKSLFSIAAIDVLSRADKPVKNHAHPGQMPLDRSCFLRSPAQLFSMSIN